MTMNLMYPSGPLAYGRDDIQTCPADDVLAAIGTSSTGCDVYIRCIDGQPESIQHMGKPIHAHNAPIQVYEIIF